MMYGRIVVPRTIPSMIAKTLVIGLLLSSNAIASTTLAEAVAQTLASNPDIAEVKNQWQARREEVNRALAGYRPTVDFNAGIGHEYTNNPATRSSGSSSVDLTRKEFGVNARQMLFDGWGTPNEVSRQRARLDSAVAQVRAVAESLALQTSEAFVDLLRFRELDALSTNNVQVHLRIQEKIRLRSDAGVGRRADDNQVSSRVALAKANKLAAEVNLVDAETTYRRIVGGLPAGDLAKPSLAAGELPADEERSIAIAQGTNPVLARARADIEAALAQNAAARQFHYPRFDLEVGGNANDNIDGVKGYDNDFTAMVRMRYNIFRGGADDARIRETAHNVSEAKDVRDRSLLQLEESTRLAWSAYRATAAQLPLLRQQVTAAQATRAAYERQFNIGQRTLLDVLNSENEVLQAQQAVVNTEADHLLAQYRILEAMGALVGHFSIALPLAEDS